MSQGGLNCPTCGAILGADPDPGFLKCLDQEHRFDVKALIGAQSNKIRDLLRATVTMLDQQGLVIQVAMEALMSLNDPTQQDRIKFLAACLLRTDDLILMLAPLTIKHERKAADAAGPQAPEDVVL